MALFKDWQNLIAIIAFIYLTLEFVIYKGFGKKAFLLSFGKWVWSIMNSYNKIMLTLEAQNKEYLSMSALIYTICQKVERIEHETTFNSGSSMKDAVVKMSDNLCIYMSEREAELYIDPKPIFKTDKNGGVIFVNAAWLEMVGCEDERQVMGMSYLAVVAEKDRDAAEKQSKRFAESPAPYHGDFVFQHLRTKELIHTNVRTQLIKDINKVFVGTIGTVKIL